MNRWDCIRMEVFGNERCFHEWEWHYETMRYYCKKCTKTKEQKVIEFDIKGWQPQQPPAGPKPPGMKKIGPGRWVSKG